MTKNGQRRSGSCCILLSVLINPWMLGKLLSPDGAISDWGSILFIVVVEGHLLLLGTALRSVEKQFPWRGIAIAVAVYCASLVGFIAFDFGVGYRRLIRQAPPDRTLAPLHQRDALLGWKPIPNISSRHKTAEYDVTYNIDQDGFRSTPRRYESKIKLFIVGDSNTFGVGVNDSETFAAVLVTRYLSDDVTVVNLGVSGYGFVQMFQRYLSVEAEVRKDDVVLFAPISWDILRDSAYIVENLAQGQWRDAESPVSYPILRNDRVEKCSIQSPRCLLNVLIESAPYGASAIGALKVKLGYSSEIQALRIVELIKKRVERRGATFIMTFLPIPDEIKSRSFDVYVGRFSYLDLEAELARYAFASDQMGYPNDGHYNPYGHRVVAQAIARALWAKGALGQVFFRHDPTVDDLLVPW